MGKVFVRASLTLLLIAFSRIVFSQEVSVVVTTGWSTGYSAYIDILPQNDISDWEVFVVVQEGSFTPEWGASAELVDEAQGLWRVFASNENSRSIAGGGSLRVGLQGSGSNLSGTFDNYVAYHSHNFVGSVSNPTGTTSTSTLWEKNNVTLAPKSGVDTIAVTNEVLAAGHVVVEDRLELSLYEPFTSSDTSYKLIVGGKVAAKGMRIDPAGQWPDYVFEESYQLMSLEEVEAYLEDEKHLPGVPSAGQVASEGVDVGVMNAVLLEKVEEITLHLIRQQKEIEALKQQNADLREKLEALDD